MGRRFTVFLIVAFFLAITCIHSTKAHPESNPNSPSLLTQEPSGEHESVPGKSGMIIDKNLIPDFDEVTPTLYRGAQPKEHGFEALAKMGVQIVVDLRGDRDSERKEVTRLGMQYVPMPWQCSLPKDKIFADFLTLIRNNPGNKIFVHCRVGDDRTGMMIAAYRMVEQAWTAKQAMEEMTKYGFSLTHRRLICPRLSEYEEHFPERFATKPEFEELRSRKSTQPAAQLLRNGIATLAAG
jgi:protein-tyrosine phosphatase